MTAWRWGQWACVRASVTKNAQASAPSVASRNGAAYSGPGPFFAAFFFPSGFSSARAAALGGRRSAAATRRSADTPRPITGTAIGRHNTKWKAGWKLLFGGR